LNKLPNNSLSLKFVAKILLLKTAALRGSTLESLSSGTDEQNARGLKPNIFWNIGFRGQNPKVVREMVLAKLLIIGSLHVLKSAKSLKLTLSVQGIRCSDWLIEL
jgi:hypothetical protein